MRKITILHTEASTGWGGQEIRILTEMRAMVQKGHRMLLACQKDSGILKKAVDFGIETCLVEFNAVYDLKGIAKLKSILVNEKVDILNTHSSKDSWIGGIAAKLSKRIKVVRTRHLSIPVKPVLSSKILYDYLTDAISTTGESIRNDLMQRLHISPDKIVSIPTGIDLSVYDINNIDTSAARREFGIGDDEPLIGTVGMIRRMKGHTYFVDAAAKIVEKFPNAKFIIVGGIPPASKETILKTNLEGQIESLGLSGKLFITGYRTDVPSLVGAMDIFVLPSIEYEGVPQAITQAMAMGKPIVASDVGAINEQVINDVTGKLIPQRNADLIASSVIELLNNSEKAKMMGENGRKLAESKFSIASMIDKTEQLYEKVLTD